MNRRMWTVVTGVTVTAVAAAMTAQAPATAAPAPKDPPPQSSSHHRDDLKSPITEHARALRKAAVDKLIKGEARTKVINGTRVIEMKDATADAPGRLKGKALRQARKDRPKYVQYDVNREEHIFTILTDFGDKADPRTGGEPGPVHNQIPKPDRSVDNSTYWRPDFNRDHYLNMLFGSDENGESFQDFYLKQSNGRFLAKGDVSDWVTVPYNESRYGSNELSDADAYWPYIRDTAQAWYDEQKAEGKSDAQIKDYLAQFDQWDRYDYDGDGDFNEPDGYIDHFQAIHAGVGEEAGGGAEGADAIWSHRWYAYSTQVGQTGPQGNKLGGVPIGDTGLWIGDYTTEPENGGLGVFSHEFGHDLGLPDEYDTMGGENGTGFWTLMSAGSWLGHGEDSIGTTPGYMGAWDKLQLGWLDYTPVNYGYDRNVRIGPADRDARNLGQAALVKLPDKNVHTDYNTPHSGQYEWWGGAADNLNTTLARNVDLTGAKTTATLSAAAEYWIEQDYDYLYGEVSTDGGQSWQQVGDPITGNSDGWTQVSFDLSAFAGKHVQFRFRYATDGGLHFNGPFLDDISLDVDGTDVWSDDVESGTNGWTADGFTRMTGSTDRKATHYYLAENRVYHAYDATLKTGPYNFVGGDTPSWVEHFPYQNGLLVWYVDNEYTDNNTSKHPGHGLVLPVDAHSAPMFWKRGARDGHLVSNRIQPWDATFGRQGTPRLRLHKDGSVVNVRPQRAVRTFDDTNSYRYWSAANPQNSVVTAGSGTKITVRKQSGQDMRLAIRFRHQGG